MSKLTRRNFITSAAALAALAAVGVNFAIADEEKADDAYKFDNADEVTLADDKKITVGASPTPHAEILNGPVKEILAEQGYELVVTEFTDYILPNTATEQGEVDANYFQHEPYLKSFNEENGTHLVPVCAVHYEPFGIYPGNVATLEEVSDGAKVAVPNDTTNEARALLLLEQEGLLKLKDGAGDTGAQKGSRWLDRDAQVLEGAAAPPHRLQRGVKDSRNELRVLVAVYAQVAGKLRKAPHHPRNLRRRLNRQLAAQLGRARAPGPGEKPAVAQLEHALLVNEERDLGGVGAAGALHKVEVHAHAQTVGASVQKARALLESRRPCQHAQGVEKPAAARASVAAFQDSARLLRGDPKVICMKDEIHLNRFPCKGRVSWVILPSSG